MRNESVLDAYRLSFPPSICATAQLKEKSPSPTSKACCPDSNGNRTLCESSCPLLPLCRSVRLARFSAWAFSTERRLFLSRVRSRAPIGDRLGYLYYSAYKKQGRRQAAARTYWLHLLHAVTVMLCSGCLALARMMRWLATDTIRYAALPPAGRGGGRGRAPPAAAAAPRRDAMDGAPLLLVY